MPESLVRVTRTAGDAQARLQVLAEELAVSLRCIGAAASELGSPGDQEAVNVRLPGHCGSLRAAGTDGLKTQLVSTAGFWSPAADPCPTD